MIKVLLVTHFYPAHKGGIEIAAYKTALNLLNTNKVDITWLASNADPSPESATNLKCLPLKSLNFIEKFLPFPYPITLPSGIITIFKQVKKCDFVHIHDFIYFSNIITFITAKLLKKRIILTQHIGFIPYKNKLLSVILGLANRTFGKFIINHAKSCVFISNNVKEYFSKIGAGAYSYLHCNSVDTHKFIIYPDVKRKYLRHEISAQNYNAVILFVGRFTEKKGVDKIIRLAERYKKILWIFAGWGTIDPESYNLPNVRVLKNVPHNKTPDLYNTADYLILPSYGEGFPLVIQEAFSCGLQVITTDENARAYPPAEKYMNALPLNNAENWNYIIKRIESQNLAKKFSPFELRAFALEHWSETKNGEFYLKFMTDFD